MTPLALLTLASTTLAADALQSLGLGLGSGEAIVNKIATICRPRYHIASMSNITLSGARYNKERDIAYVRPPYRNMLGNTLHGESIVTTRFLSLSSIPSTEEATTIAKDKSKKWMHALSLDPIIHMNTNDVYASVIGSTDFPYVDSIKSDQTINSGINKRTCFCETNCSVVINAVQVLPVPSP